MGVAFASAAAAAPMNRYRAKVTFAPQSRCTRVMHAAVVHRFDIEACNIRVAANRALEGFEDREDVSVTVTLAATNIVRGVMARGSHGKAGAARRE